ncbi:UNVERIFIED_CONTAM: hypothetical protein FKN15_067854 [Acipenser sinensis]
MEFGPVKRKTRVTISRVMKREMCLYWENNPGETYREIADTFQLIYGVKAHHVTVSRIIRDREKWLSADNKATGNPTQAKKTRPNDRQDKTLEEIPALLNGEQEEKISTNTAAVAVDTNTLCAPSPETANRSRACGLIVTKDTRAPVCKRKRCDVEEPKHPCGVLSHGESSKSTGSVVNVNPSVKTPSGCVKPKVLQVENSVFLWLMSIAVERRVPVPDEIVLKVSKQFGELVGVSDFVFTKEWLSGVYRRLRLALGTGHTDRGGLVTMQ